jgi:hypothetical protein
MAINLSKIAKGVVLPFAAGAAKGYMAKRDLLEKEFRENKRRQEEWMATYGRKALADNQAKEDTIESAAQRIKGAGLPDADVIQLLEIHGPESVLELSKLVQEYQAKNREPLTEELMAQAFEGIEDYDVEGKTIEQAVQDAFEVVKMRDTSDPVDTEEMGFLERLSYNLSGERESEKLKKFLDQDYEGGLSINEVRELAYRGMPRGTGDLATFDTSVFQTGYSSENKENTKMLKNYIQAQTLNLLSGLEDEMGLPYSDVIKFDEANNELLSSKIMGNILLKKDTDDNIKNAFEQAIRDSYVKRARLWENNNLAEMFFGGPDYLASLRMTVEQQMDALIENEEMTQDEKNNIQEFDTREDHANSEQRYGIVDGVLVFRQPEGSGGSEGGSEGDSEEGSGIEPVTPAPVEFDPETFELAVQPEPEPVVPPKPNPEYYLSGRERTSSKEAREEWEEKYGKSYTDTGSKRYVSPRPARDPNNLYPYESWMYQWGNSHNPETGAPLMVEEDQ